MSAKSLYDQWKFNNVLVFFRLISQRTRQKITITFGTRRRLDPPPPVKSIKIQISERKYKSLTEIYTN